jgi:hypothetical protein
LATGAAPALVLTAAVSHAFWNALAKRARNRLVFVWSAAAVVLVGVVVSRSPASRV